MKYILKPAAVLFITAVITVTLLSVAYNLTLEPIENQKRKTQEAAMKEVLPRADKFSEIQIELSGSMSAVYEGFIDDMLVGYVVKLSPKGYGGAIDLITGISVLTNTLIGMRVIKHTETPGLGALAVKGNFYRQFNSRELARLNVTRSSPGENEIQAITSSTVTTRAVTNAVNEAIEWYLKTHIPYHAKDEHEESAGSEDGGESE